MVLAREWAERAPGPRSQSSLVGALNRSGRSAEAVEAARRLVAFAPGSSSRYTLAKNLILADRFEEAEGLLEPFVGETASPRDRRDALMLHASAIAHQGRRREAIDILGAWERIPGAVEQWTGWWVPFNRWILQIDERKPEPALREAEAIRKKSGRGTHALYLGLPLLGDDRGAAEAATSVRPWDRDLHEAIATCRRGDLDGAVAKLQAIVPKATLGQALALRWLAYAAFDARQDAVAMSATETYERLPEIYDMWRPWGLGRLLYKKALAQERQGDRAGATATVERMLAMWKRADPDLPLLAETRALCRKLGCKAPVTSRSP